MKPEMESSCRKRILHFTFEMEPGGTEQVVRQLLLNLPPERFENHILCIDGKVGEIGVHLQSFGIEVSSLKKKRGFDWNHVCRIRSKIKQHKISILHRHQYTPWIYGLLASIGTGARVVFNEHGRFYPDRYRYKTILANPLLALMTDSIIAISSATRDALARYEFVLKSRIRLVYDGIRGLTRNPQASANIRRDLGIPTDGYVLGTGARLVPVKNQVMMLEAFSQILEQHPHCWLLIVGDGSDLTLLEKKARGLAVEGRVAFTGFTDSPADYLATIDLFLLSSNTEDASMTLLEAMNLAIPSVVTGVGGNSKIITDGQTGMICKIGSSSDMTRAIDEMYSSRELSQSLSTEGRCYFEKNFEIDNMVESYISIYLDRNGSQSK